MNRPRCFNLFFYQKSTSIDNLTQKHLLQSMETDKRLLSLQLNGKTCQYQALTHTKTNVPIVKRFLNYDVKKGKIGLSSERCSI